MQPRDPRLASVVLLALVTASCGSSGPSMEPGASAQAGVPAALSPGHPALPDVPAFKMDARRSELQPGPGPLSTPVEAWRYAIGDEQLFIPILADGRIIAGNDAGTLHAVDARTGAKVWQFSAAGAFHGSAAAADGLVFVADLGGVLHALDLVTGTERWNYALPNLGQRPIIADGRLYIGSIDRALGFDPATGSVEWSWQGPTGLDVTIGAVADGVAYLMATDGRLYAASTTDGATLWSLPTISGTLGYPTIDRDTIYEGTFPDEGGPPNGVTYAIDRPTGAIRWQFSSPSHHQAIPGPVREGVVYVNTELDGIYGLRDDGTTSTVLWHTDAPTSWQPMVLVGDILYQARADGSLGAYATAGGNLIWETAPIVDTGAGTDGPIVSGGFVFTVERIPGTIRAWAEPGLVAMLPRPSATAAPSSSTGPTAAPNPFAEIRAIPLSKLGLAIPFAMDVGPDGLLYILDTAASVTVVDPNAGTVVRKWGSQGTAPGEFDLTRSDDNPGNGDLAVAADGLVYVADGSNHRIQVFSSDGRFVRQFGSFGGGDGQFENPAVIAIAKDGDVLVSDEGRADLQKLSPIGTPIWRIGGSGASDPDLRDFHGPTVMPDGSLLLSTGGQGHLVFIDPDDGHVITRWGGVDTPLGAIRAGMTSVDGLGRVYLREFEPQVARVFSPDGVLLGSLSEGPGFAPSIIGHEAHWGGMFQPAPVFTPAGEAYTFNEDGLIELRINLPGS